MVLFAMTSRDAWSTLQTSSASQSTARSMQIRRQLGELKKRDLPASVFFQQVKTLADTLSSIGQPLRHEEFTSYVLNGLDGDYDSLVEVVNGRDLPMPPRDLYARLLSTEQRIEARRSADIYSATPSANAAYRRGSRAPARPAIGAGGGKPLLSTPPPQQQITPTVNSNRNTTDTVLCVSFAAYRGISHHRATSGSSATSSASAMTDVLMSVSSRCQLVHGHRRDGSCHQ